METFARFLLFQAILHLCLVSPLSGVRQLHCWIKTCKKESCKKAQYQLAVTLEQGYLRQW